MAQTKALIDDVLNKKTWLLRENANTQMSPSLLNLYLASQAKEEFVLKELYSKDVVRHHLNGSIYIHTLHDPFKPYCNGLDARIFLLDGLKFPHCRSAPAKHFISAVYQSMAFIFYSQLFFSGAQAIDYYNWFFAPYLRHDRLDYGQVKEILQGFVFQLNQSNRTGAQSAFSNVGMRIKCPPYLKDEPAIFAGRKLESTYGEFEPEARMIYKALMEVMGDGDGSGAPFTFPIVTTAITKDFNWDDELVDITMETTSKTGSPYFLNFLTDYLDEKYVHAMCCRLLATHSAGVWMAGGLGCVTGDTRILLRSGEMETMRDLADKLTKEVNGQRIIACNHNLIALDSRLRPRNYRTSFFHAYPCDKVYEIKTASGRSIKATPNHPLLVLDNDKIKWEEVQNIEKGKQIALLRKSPKPTKREIPLNFNLGQKDFHRNIRYRIKFLSRLNKELAELLGFLLSEGSYDLSSRGHRIYFWNRNDKLKLRAKELFTSVFGINPIVSKRYVKIGSKMAYIFLQRFKGLTVRDRERKVPPEIFRSSNKVVSVFLRSLFDGDGTVALNIKRSDRRVSLSTTSKEMAKDVQMLLTRFGIITSLFSEKRRDPNHNIRYLIQISGKRNIELFDKEIGFLHPKKKEKLSKLLLSYAGRPSSNVDFVNVDPNILREIRRTLGFSTTELGVNPSLWILCENGKRKIDFWKLKGVSSLFRSRFERFDAFIKAQGNSEFHWGEEETGLLRKLYRTYSDSEIATIIGRTKAAVRGKRGWLGLNKKGGRKNPHPEEVNRLRKEWINVQKEKIREKIDFLEKVTSEDIFWDAVKSIELRSTEDGYVYDLEVPEAHNFVVDGIVSHNTGSNKVCTLNLPHIALISKNEKNFFSTLDEEMEVARKALKESNAIIKTSMDKWKILPWLKMTTDDGVPYYNFKERRLTFGMIGLNECLLNLIGKPLTSKEGLQLGLKIVARMDADIKKFSKKDKVVYTLEQTPGESATYKLARKDRARFGKRAHVQGKGKEVYYSNSSHVAYKDDISFFDKVQIEAEFHPYFTGGAIAHFWIGEARPEPGSLRNLVQKMCKTKLAYFAFAPDYSICESNHYHRGKLAKCPACGGKVIDYISRVVGYFTRVSNWNPGKQREYQERKRFDYDFSKGRS